MKMTTIAILLALLFWLSPGGPASAVSETSRWRPYEGELRLQIIPETPSPDPLHYVWPVPKVWATQRVVEYLSVHPAPEQEIIERFHGSLLYHWKLPGDVSTEIVLRFRWRALDESLSLDPDDVIDYPKDDEILETALEPIPGRILSASEQEFLDRLNRQEQNPLKKAQHIFHALRRETGPFFDPAASSEEAALRWTTLCRAAGIPARPVSGYLIPPDHPAQAHSWGEFYLSPVGWVPVDPVAAAEHENEHFSQLQADRLILSKGGSVPIPEPLDSLAEFENFAGTVVLSNKGFCSRPESVSVFMSFQTELLQPGESDR